MRTGGYLNIINEKYKCNDPNKTIRISSLLRHHAPRTEQDMLKLIRGHDRRCALCGEMTRNGGLSGWIQALQDAVTAEQASVSLEECCNFIYDLYVRAPVQGFLFEDRAVQWLRQCGYKDVRLATPQEDCEFAVDIVITSNGTVVGLQVKPDSYHRVRTEVHAMNAAKNKKARFPIVYLYYDKCGRWENNGTDVLNSLWLLFQRTRIY